jgi:hypothetical protein
MLTTRIPLSILPAMIDILDAFPCVGMVCGNRFYNKPKEAALNRWFYFGNKLLAFMHSFLNGVGLQDSMTGLRVIRVDFLRDLLIKSNGFDIEVELNSQLIKRGFEIREVPVYYRERLGKKKLKMKHGTTILKRILREAL